MITEHRKEDERFRGHPCNACSFLTWYEAGPEDNMNLLLPVCEEKHPYMMATAACGALKVKGWKGEVVVRRGE